MLSMVASFYRILKRHAASAQRHSSQPADPVGNQELPCWPHHVSPGTHGVLWDSLGPGAANLNMGQRKLPGQDTGKGLHCHVSRSGTMASLDRDHAALILDSKLFLSETVFQNAHRSGTSWGRLLQSSGPNGNETYVCTFYMTNVLLNGFLQTTEIHAQFVVLSDKMLECLL